MMETGAVVDSLGTGSRRRRSAEERRLIVEETLEAGASVARVAMKHGVNANQVFKWKRLHETGSPGKPVERPLQLLPVQVTEERQVKEPSAPAVLAAGSIQIELPGRVRIRLEGQVDLTMVRLVLKSLRP